MHETEVSKKGMHTSTICLNTHRELSNQVAQPGATIGEKYNGCSSSISIEILQPLLIKIATQEFNSNESQ